MPADRRAERVERAAALVVAQAVEHPAEQPGYEGLRIAGLVAEPHQSRRHALLRPLHAASAAQATGPRRPRRIAASGQGSSHHWRLKHARARGASVKTGHSYAGSPALPDELLFDLFGRQSAAHVEVTGLTPGHPCSSLPAGSRHGGLGRRVG
jgi:hypothetical protein